MTSFTAAVLDTIKDVLPNVSAEDSSAVVDKLADIGVESTDDLQHVMEKDLAPPLKPIQARKLLSAWSQPSTPTASKFLVYSSLH